MTVGDASERVYMVSGADRSGDTHIFVTEDRGRAERRYEVMLAEFTDVKANWLEYPPNL